MLDEGEGRCGNLLIHPSAFFSDIIKHFHFSFACAKFKCVFDFSMELKQCRHTWELSCHGMLLNCRKIFSPHRMRALGIHPKTVCASQTSTRDSSHQTVASLMA
ncbi:hypothetical protein GOODEAATRI_002054 [Goodea atripinnis]|uniref:Uncharacterized protein n=1 Tax=Goodea atripinnis TaxID=208336 RepID=A0ABV0P0Q5_9TELE